MLPLTCGVRRLIEPSYLLLKTILRRETSSHPHKTRLKPCYYQLRRISTPSLTKKETASVPVEDTHCFGWGDGATRDCSKKHRVPWKTYRKGNLGGTYFASNKRDAESLCTRGLIGFFRFECWHEQLQATLSTTRYQESGC